MHASFSSVNKAFRLCIPFGICTSDDMTSCLFMVSCVHNFANSLKGSGRCTLRGKVSILSTEETHLPSKFILCRNHSLVFVNTEHSKFLPGSMSMGGDLVSYSVKKEGERCWQEQRTDKTIYSEWFTVVTHNLAEKGHIAGFCANSQLHPACRGSLHWKCVCLSKRHTHSRARREGTQSSDVLVANDPALRASSMMWMTGAREPIWFFSSLFSVKAACDWSRCVVASVCKD